MSSIAQNWKPVGDSLFSDYKTGEFAASIRMSADGLVMAVADDNPKDDDDRVFILTWSNKDSAWVHKGSPFTDVLIDDNKITCLTLSRDGNVLAYATLNSQQGWDKESRIRIFQWNGNDWEEKGRPLVAGREDVYLGMQLCLNKNGNRLIVSYPLNNSNGKSSGTLRTFDWNGSNWAKACADIVGDSAYNEMGSHISLSDDGNVLAVTGSRSQYHRSFVNVLEWTGQQWIQRGEAIYDTQSLTLSGDGNTLAVYLYKLIDNKASYTIGVYQWSNGWAAKGRIFNAYHFYATLALNYDGTVFAIGWPQKGVYDDGFGSAQVYEWKNNLWRDKGSLLEGYMKRQHLGQALVLDHKGDRIIISGLDMRRPMGERGYAIVYDFVPGKELQVNDSITLRILFHKGTAEVVEDSRPELVRLWEYMQEHPTAVIELEGHTEKDEPGYSTAQRKANYTLSLQRVTLIRQYLIDQGIATKRVKIKAYGGTRPVSKNPQENRRVVLKLLKI